MAKDRTEFIYSLGDKLILGTLAAVFTFFILEHIKSSFSEETDLRSRFVESANILSRHYLDTSNQAIEEIQKVKSGAEQLSRLGDVELLNEEELRLEILSAASRGVSKLNEMLVLADPERGSVPPHEGIEHSNLRQERYASVQEFLQEISVSVISENNPSESWPAEADRHISTLASEISEDVRIILRSEMNALGERRQAWQLDGFWVLVAAVFICLTAGIAIYFKLPGQRSV